MIHAIVKLTITDAEKFAAYAERAGEALKKYNGAPIAQSKSPEVIEGDVVAPSRAVVLTFPDKESALGWINDPELAEIHALRTGAGKSEIILLA